MTIEPLLRRALAVTISLVASAGIVSAGVVASPVWADAALERAEIVHSPDAHRPGASLTVEPAAAHPEPEFAAPRSPLRESPPAPDPAPAPAPGPAPPAPARAPVPETAPSPARAPAPAPTPAPPPAQAPGPAQPSASNVGTRDAGCESSMLRWMNETRASAGRRALAWDDAILHVAVDWSHDMAASGELAHNPDYGERVFAARAEAMTAAENVGWGADTARAVYDEFLRSPTHEDKILSTALTHAAVGCVRDGAGEVWVTVNFWG